MTPSPATNEEAHRPRLHRMIPVIDKAAQNKFILELAMKTVKLMQRNKLIQQKIIVVFRECRACLRMVSELDCHELFEAGDSSWSRPGTVIADDLANLAEIEVRKYRTYQLHCIN